MTDGKKTLAEYGVGIRLDIRYKYLTCAHSQRDGDQLFQFEGIQQVHAESDCQMVVNK